MWAWCLQGGFGISHLHYSDVSVPVVGPQDVLIRVEAVSLNYRARAAPIATSNRSNLFTY